MNITFLIGNGFDLNLGLKTGYKDFLRFYLDQESINPKTKKVDEDIVAFKKLISEDIEYWSQLEKALGEKTIEAPLNTVEGIIRCKTDLDRSLQKYLKKQQTLLIFADKNQRNAAMQKSLDQFALFCKPRTRDRLQGMLQVHRDNLHFNAITFNYTNAFDLCFEGVPKSIGAHRTNGTTYEHVKGKCIHLHGTTEQSMIVGVDDKSQIANEQLADDPRVQRCLIKPKMNANSQEMRDDEAKRLIDNSTIIVVFGMSIGETDRTWWKSIANKMLGNTQTQLIIVDYFAEYDPSFTYLLDEPEDIIVERFLNVSKLNSAAKDSIRGRISVLFNTEMFKIETKNEVDQNEIEEALKST